jgi:hypothetical protein
MYLISILTLCAKRLFYDIFFCSVWFGQGSKTNILLAKKNFIS